MCMQITYTHTHYVYMTIHIYMYSHVSKCHITGMRWHTLKTLISLSNIIH